MAKSSKQTFKKRQREINKRQKKEDKAKRLAARRSQDSTNENSEMEMNSSLSFKSKEEKPTLKILPIGRDFPKPDRT